MKNNFNREVLQNFDASYGVPFSAEEAEVYARQAIRFGAWESVIRAIDSMSVTQKQEDRWQYLVGTCFRTTPMMHNLKEPPKISINDWQCRVMIIIICLPKIIWGKSIMIALPENSRQLMISNA